MVRVLIAVAVHGGPRVRRRRTVQTLALGAGEIPPARMRPWCDASGGLGGMHGVGVGVGVWERVAYTGMGSG